MPIQQGGGMQLYDAPNCDYEPPKNFQQNFGNPYDCPEGFYNGSLMSSVGYSQVIFLIIIIIIIMIRVEKVEIVRWPVTMTLLGVCSVFCLLLFIGAIVHSRGTLILFSVCGLFSIILLWLITAVYITLAVAVAG